MEFSSTVKYIVSSLWKNRNPFNWPLSMQIGATSALVLSLTTYAEGLTESIDFMGGQSEENDDDASLTFRCLEYTSEEFERAALQINSCLHHLGEVAQQVMPRQKVSHFLHHNLINFFWQFAKNITVIETPIVSTTCKHFISWAVQGSVFESFNASLTEACTHLIDVKDLWSGISVNVPVSIPDVLDNTINGLQVEEISLWDAFSNSTHCLGVPEMCKIVAKELFYAEFPS